MFKSTQTIISILLFLFFTTAFAANLPDIQKILDKGKLVVAVNANDAPPMFWTNEQGQLVGYDIDLANDLGKSLGVPVEFVREPQTFNEVIDFVSDGKADIGVSLLTPNLERAKKIIFSDPYVYLDKLFVYNRLAMAKLKLRDPVTEMHAVKGLKLGVLKGSAYVNDAAHYYPHGLQLYSTAGEGLAAVKSGEIFGFFTNSAHLPYWMAKDASLNLYVAAVSMEGKVDPISIAISGEYPELVEWINLALALRKAEGAGDELEKHYSINSQVAK